MSNPLYKQLTLLNTIQRHEWLIETSNGLQKDFTQKYQAGQAEHMGDLGAASIDQLLKEMYQEHLDSIAYIAEFKRRLGVGQVVIGKDKLTQLYSLALERVNEHGKNQIDSDLLVHVKSLIQ